MRANGVGWGLVALFLVGGIAFWVLMPEIWIGQIWVGVSLLLIVVYLGMGRAANKVAELQRTGVRGQAQILEMTQTGVYVNEQPRVKFKLRVSAPGIPIFDDEKTVTVPLIALGQLSGGMPLTVYMKPESPRDYVIDWSGGFTASNQTVMGPITVTGDTSTQTTTIGPGSDAGQAVMAALQAHGVDTSSGSVDLRNVAGAREAVLKALKDHGVDVAHQIAAAMPTTPIQAQEEAPMERMQKLQQLRDANLITAEEFEENRKRILKEI